MLDMQCSIGSKLRQPMSFFCFCDNSGSDFLLFIFLIRIFRKWNERLFEEMVSAFEIGVSQKGTSSTHVADPLGFPTGLQQQHSHVVSVVAFLFSLQQIRLGDGTKGKSCSTTITLFR